MSIASPAITAILVDDERLARRELARLLAAHPGVVIAGEASTLEDAVELVRVVEPDLIFLDIQLSPRSGFELFDLVEVRGRVVFVTAHDIHALRAFEVNALDYLLKPVDPARLQNALGRLGRETGEPPRGCALELDDVVYLRERRGAHLLRVHAIVAILGADDYTEVVRADGRRLLASRTLREWESRLPPAAFARVHRTAIVQLDFIEQLDRVNDDTFRARLRGGAPSVPVSRRYAARLRRHLA